MVQYNEQTKQFEDNGKVIEAAAILLLIDRLTSVGKREAKRISGRLERGEISVAQWRAAIAELLKSAHIIAASVGRGGRSRMTQSDWGKVGNKLRWQYGFLDKFTRSIVSGAVVIGAGVIANRAIKYLSAPYISFQTAKQAEHTIGVDGKPVMVRLVQNSKEGCSECAADASLGFIPVDDMDPIGSRICGDFCLCDLEFSDEV